LGASYGTQLTSFGHEKSFEVRKVAMDPLLGLCRMVFVVQLKDGM
jgi:hypothetical protein